MTWRWWRRRPRRVEPAPVAVWVPPPYVLPVDTEPPEHYCGTPDERRAWAEASRLRRQHEAAEAARVADRDAAETARAGWALRDQVDLLAVERERAAAQAALAADQAAARAGLDAAAAAREHRAAVDDLARRTALQLAQARADALLSPPSPPGGDTEETPPATGGEPEVSPQVSGGETAGGDPDPWVLPEGCEKIDEAHAWYLAERRAGRTPTLARINRHIGSRKYVVRDHVTAWDAELAQERRFRAVGGE